MVQLLTFYTDSEPHYTQRYRRADTQTDRRYYDANNVRKIRRSSRSYRPPIFGPLFFTLTPLPSKLYRVSIRLRTAKLRLAG